MKTYVKWFLISLVVLVVAGAFVVGLGAAGITTAFAFILPFYYFGSFTGMDIKKLPTIVVSSALGLICGLVNPLITAYVDPSGVAGIVAMLVVILLCMTIGLSTIEKPLKLIDMACLFLFLTVATTCSACFTFELVPQIVVGWVVGVLLCLLVGGLVGMLGKKKAAQANDAQVGE